MLVYYFVHRVPMQYGVRFELFEYGKKKMEYIYHKYLCICEVTFLVLFDLKVKPIINLSSDNMCSLCKYHKRTKESCVYKAETDQLYKSVKLKRQKTEMRDRNKVSTFSSNVE